MGPPFPSLLGSIIRLRNFTYPYQSTRAHRLVKLLRSSTRIVHFSKSDNILRYMKNDGIRRSAYSLTSLESMGLFIRLEDTTLRDYNPNTTGTRNIVLHSNSASRNRTCLEIKLPETNSPVKEHFRLAVISFSRPQLSRIWHSSTFPKS
jgi:hypothetical protein